jgi:retron-type reverse transcriptase
VNDVEKKISNNERLKILFDSYIESAIIPSLNEDEYNKEFKSFKRLKSKKLPYIYDIDHFCNLTNSSSRQVKLFLSNKDKGYTTLNVQRPVGVKKGV